MIIVRFDIIRNICVGFSYRREEKVFDGEIIKKNCFYFLMIILFGWLVMAL